MTALVHSDRSGNGVVAPLISFKLKLACARRFLCEPQSGLQEGAAVSACRSVIDESTDCECRATAFYYLGLIELKKARIAGDLARLWAGYSNQEDSSSTAARGQDFASEAKKHFMKMLPLIGPPTEILTRDALRCLALTSGPCAVETAEMIHTSIGGSLRQVVARNMEKHAESSSCSDVKIAEVLKSLDIAFADQDRKERVHSLFSTIERLLPPDWRVIACALCPSGEMLISSLTLDALGDIKVTNACIFPESDSVPLYDAIMVPLDRIISSNQEQLQNVTTEDTLPQQWWSNRKDVDTKLRDLVAEVERTWFASEAAQAALVGDENFGDRLPFHVNLASRFEAATISSNASATGEESIDSSRNEACSLLILDENLQRFPFESLSMFEGLTLCRQPSLPFLAAKLLDLSGDAALEFRQAYADMQKVSYVLDPESNLSATTKRLKPFLDAMEANCSANSWQRVVRETPPKDFIERSLTQPEGLYLFFGHGNGQSYFSKSDVECLIGGAEGDATQRRIRSSVVLMGCSSGRLESVNRKDTKLLDRQLPLYHEPEGLALFYVGAGANCVVGNLWDVTDREIDTFAMRMLERFTADDASTSIAECVAHSRMACKLRYATGGAPVCYGIPVFRKNA